MSSPEASELKGGHPPAVKAGGMRVARPHHSSGEAKNEMTKEEEEEYGTSPPKSNKDAVVVSGVVAKEEKAYPPQAVKHYHEAHLPSKEMRPIQPKHAINQPK